MKKVQDLKADEAKAVLGHMENRTQWHKDDVERVEALRNKVTADEMGGKLTPQAAEANKVKHRH
jgi:hypothetical protein